MFEGFCSPCEEGNRYTEALDFDTFGEVSNRKAIKEFRKFCRIKHTAVVTGSKKKFTCNAWLRLFKIAEPITPEYVREFLESVYLDESITTLHINYFWFQLGGVRHEMNMRQFILTMGLYTEKEVGSGELRDFYEYCLRHRPNEYNPDAYVTRISDITEYNMRKPPSYNSIKFPIQRLVHRLIALSIKAMHSARGKVTVDDFFVGRYGR